MEQSKSVAYTAIPPQPLHLLPLPARTYVSIRKEKEPSIDSRLPLGLRLRLRQEGIEQTEKVRWPYQLVSSDCEEKVRHMEALL